MVAAVAEHVALDVTVHAQTAGKTMSPRISTLVATRLESLVTSINRLRLRRNILIILDGCLWPARPASRPRISGSCANSRIRFAS